jgi:hypothetical protein
VQYVIVSIFDVIGYQSYCISISRVQVKTCLCLISSIDPSSIQIVQTFNINVSQMRHKECALDNVIQSRLFDILLQSYCLPISRVAVGGYT